MSPTGGEISSNLPHGLYLFAVVRLSHTLSRPLDLVVHAARFRCLRLVFLPLMQRGVPSQLPKVLIPQTLQGIELETQSLLRTLSHQGYLFASCPRMLHGLELFRISAYLQYCRRSSLHRCRARLILPRQYQDGLILLDCPNSITY